MAQKRDIDIKYPVLRLRHYDEDWNNTDGFWCVYKLQTRYRDIYVERDDEGKVKLYNGKPRYSIDLHHDFCYIGEHGKGGWVVANLWMDPDNVTRVCNCEPDSEVQEMHGEFPPVGRWSQCNRWREARWHVEKLIVRSPYRILTEAPAKK